MAAAGRRMLKPRDSLAHAWADGTITAFQPGVVVNEADILEGAPAERRAFFDEAVKARLFEDVTEAEEEREGSGGRRKAAP